MAAGNDDDNIIFEEGVQDSPAHLAIDSQLLVLQLIQEMRGDYETFEEQKITVQSQAMQIIMRAQKKIFKDLK